MSDRISKTKRSWNMSRIRGKDTKIEVLVRKWLFKEGFRFRKNDKRYPGKPDVVLPKYMAVIFINGCFWHRHQYCKNASIPKTRTEFWTEKLEKNVLNDKKNYALLEEKGWKVIILWECELEKDLDGVMNRVVEELKGESPYAGK